MALTMNTSTCPACGAPLEPDASFCTMCGTRLTMAPPTPAAQPAPAPAAEPAASTTADTCPYCGFPLEPDAKFCVMCGRQVPSHSGPQAPQGAQNAPAAVTPNASAGRAPQPYATASAPTPAPASAPAPAPAPAARATPMVTMANTANDLPDDDDPTVRPLLIMLSHDEARTGCHKLIKVDGQEVPVDIPAGVNATTKLDIPNLGYFDEFTGSRGPLRLTFFLI